ncbi:MAG: methytransferase partner Trm112 [Candidatus Thermoplasmatota archaeon]|nr:methytransferase partner Trm112 [Candidatus Thermoplasmatota archaeon]
MKKDMMDMLCCPACKSPLELTIDLEDNNEVIKGKLKCTSCDTSYPIVDGIPNFIDETE